MFIKRSEAGLVIILVYVDDLIFAGSSDGLVDSAINEFLAKFEGVNEGSLEWYLGVKIAMLPERIELSQTAYIDSILEHYELSSAHSRPTPMVANFFDELSAHQNEPVLDNAAYRHTIGCLLFLSTRTRPDILLATSILAQFVEVPTKYLYKQAQRVLLYLKGTREMVLTFLKSDEDLNVFVDSDYAGSTVDRKSRSGVIALLGGNVVEYYTRKQKCVALSSSEAEYIALSESCKTITFIRGVLGELLGPIEEIQLNCDNDAARGWGENDCSMRRAKHIDVRYHYVQECVSSKIVKLQYVPSAENLADGFTKPLDRVKFTQFRTRLGLQHPTSSC